MKLATLDDGSADGRLVVVSRDLRAAAPVPHARSLQQALDHWDDSLAEMLALSVRLNEGRVLGTLEFNPQDCRSPLPRAVQWVRQRDAQIVQGASDAFLAPMQDIALADESWYADLRAGLAAITGPVASGAEAATAAQSLRLLMLVNDPVLGQAGVQGLGPLQASPGAAFSPVAVTPDELGAAWDGRRLHARLRCFVNGVKLGEIDLAGNAEHDDLPQLIARTAQVRRLGAGSIFGVEPSTAVPARAIAEGGAGYAHLAQLREAEARMHGAPRTPWLGLGDRVLLDLLDAERLSVFGAIEQRVSLRAR